MLCTHHSSLADIRRKVNVLSVYSMSLFLNASWQYRPFLLAYVVLDQLWLCLSTLHYIDVVIIGPMKKQTEAEDRDPTSGQLMAEEQEQTELFSGWPNSGHNCQRNVCSFKCIHSNWSACIHSLTAAVIPESIQPQQKLSRFIQQSIARELASKTTLTASSDVTSLSSKIA